MLELMIADLIADDLKFNIPSSLGIWVFKRRQDYDEQLDKIEKGQCATTFYAYNDSIDHTSSDDDLKLAIYELIDICLLLSFISAKCVTPVSSISQSDIVFIQLGDKFIRPRPIVGLPKLQLKTNLNAIFSIGTTNLFSKFSSRRMELFLAHWISSITCFTLEDLFLSITVQMDIVKQCEIQAAKGRKLNYMGGMTEASTRFKINPLSYDYNNMRHDIIHEGKLSALQFKRKTKSDCAGVIANTLNWIDEYVSKVANINSEIVSFDRWCQVDLEYMLPAFSFHM
jgi:hypothetical protein